MGFDIYYMQEHIDDFLKMQESMIDILRLLMILQKIILFYLWKNYILSIFSQSK